MMRLHSSKELQISRFLCDTITIVQSGNITRYLLPTGAFSHNSQFLVLFYKPVPSKISKSMFYVILWQLTLSINIIYYPTQSQQDRISRKAAIANQSY